MVNFTSMEVYYEIVRKGDIASLYGRHSNYPKIVMECALNDFQLDVAERLVKEKIVPDYRPLFHSNVKYVDSIIGFKHYPIDNDEMLEKKFDVCLFLIKHGFEKEDVIIPKFLYAQWLSYKINLF